MNIVQGFLGGFPVLGVLAPVLPSVGDFKSSPSALERSGVSVKDEVSWGPGEDAAFAASGVLAPPSREPLFFLSFRLAFSDGVDAPDDGNDCSSHDGGDYCD